MHNIFYLVMIIGIQLNYAKSYMLWHHFLSPWVLPTSSNLAFHRYTCIQLYFIQLSTPCTLIDNWLDAAVTHVVWTLLTTRILTSFVVVCSCQVCTTCEAPTQHLLPGIYEALKAYVSGLGADRCSSFHWAQDHHPGVTIFVRLYRHPLLPPKLPPLVVFLFPVVGF